MILFMPRHLIPRLLLPLISYLLFFLQLFYHVLFVTEKNQKVPAQDKISRNVLLLASRKRHPSVGRYLPFNAGRWNSCAPELVRFSVIIKDNAAALQTCPRLIMNSTGIEL